jgi:hypothetical protein
MRDELALYGETFPDNRARRTSARTRANKAIPPVQQEYILYKGYRIHTPPSGDFRRDNHGCYQVHIQLSRIDGAIQELIPIPASVAGSIAKARDMSIKHAHRIVDERANAFCPAAAGRVEYVSTLAMEPVSAEDELRRPSQCDDSLPLSKDLLPDGSSRADTFADDRNRARLELAAMDQLTGRDRDLARANYVVSLQALHTSLVSDLDQIERLSEAEVKRVTSTKSSPANVRKTGVGLSVSAA